MSRLLHFCLLAAVLAIRASAADESEASRRTVTIEAVLQRKYPTITELHWTPHNDAITAKYFESRGGTSVMRVWPVERSSARKMPRKRAVESKQDEIWSVSSDASSWIITGTGTANKGRHISVARSARPASPAFRVAWSRTGRYVALLEPSLLPAEVSSAPRTENGVRVLRIAEKAEQNGALLTVIDVAKPQEITHVWLTGRVGALEWAPGEALYISRVYYWSDVQDGKPYSTIEELHIHGATMRTVFRIDGIQQTMRPHISHSGEWLAFACDVDDRRWPDFVSLVALDLQTLKWKRLTTSEPVLDDAIVWSHDDDALFVPIRDGGWTQLYRVDMRGNSRQLTSAATLKSLKELSSDGRRISYLAHDGHGRVEIRVIDVDGQHDRSVAIIDDPQQQFSMGDFRQVRFASEGNLQVAAFVVYPPDFDPHRRYPLYVDVHGGGPGSTLYLRAPLTVDLAPGPLEWHAWAALGFVVLVPDYRSTGAYGPGTAAARYRNLDFDGIVADALDIERGTQWLVRMPYIDSARVAIRGSSAGGSRVNFLLTRSSVYHAGVIFEPIPSGVLASVLDATTGTVAGSGYWEQFFLENIGATLKERPDLYKEGFLLDGYKSHTPTLIMLGGGVDKGGVDPLSAEVLLSVLKQYRVPAELLRYVDEGHTLRHPEAVLHAFHESVLWLDKYLDIARDGDGRVAYQGDQIRPRASSSSELH